jgi:uncharacterized protein (TIGR00251 family)
MQDAITAAGADTIIRVYVTPRARQSELAGEREGALWVRVAAAPVEGAANQALIELLARTLGVARSAVVLEAGAWGRQKRVRVVGMTSDEVKERLGRVGSSG